MGYSPIDDQRKHRLFYLEDSLVVTRSRLIDSQIQYHKAEQAIQWVTYLIL